MSSSQTPSSAGRMRATRPRPASQHVAAAAPSSTTTPPRGRTVFNCIVDDSALVAGVKRSTRNGIRQWVKNGQISLFVPLHALDQLGLQKNANSRHGDDVRETLQWLDDATSRYPKTVCLQGPEDVFENWSDVEKFAVPRTLFSETDILDEFDPEQDEPSLPNVATSDLSLPEVPRETPASSAASNASRSVSPSSRFSQRSSISALSPPTSPAKATSSPAKSNHIQPSTTSSSSSTVPLKLQPLFNYIIWRIHQEENPAAALETFIFLCNDQSKVNHAKGFEIKTKRLEQLRDAVGREDRDFKNRLALWQKENPNATGTAATNITSGSDRVSSKSPGAVSATSAQPLQQQHVMDPDAFGRNPQSSKLEVHAPTVTVPSPRLHHAVPQASRGHVSLPFSPRGNIRGNNLRGAPRGRGNVGPITHAGFSPSPVPAGPEIDPNSFIRPRGSGYTGRGGRKLWVPT